MTDRYDPAAIEPRWRERWERDDIYHAPDDDPRPKWYALTMFPYPSGDLHTGHWYAMAPSDVGARYRRMLGYNVMFPIGFDAFGLNAENAAIKRGIDPRDWTYQNMERMRGQLRMMGASFDWTREIVTCDPEFYKWTQWWFLQFFNRDLAYRADAPANWCPSCKTTLANEQVIGGLCERCDSVVIQRRLTQWFFRITAYADELLDFSHMEWPERVQGMQRNWIGRSQGARLNFAVDVEGVDDSLTVFTTRPDTVFGATFMVLAPEHPLVERITTDGQRAEVEAYVAHTQLATEIERLATDREKTGAFTGAYAINPFNGARVPIWIADYVLLSYGTGAIMAVPAHDERDFEFATKFGIEVIPVFDHAEIDVAQPLTAAFTDGTTMINSGPLDGTPRAESIDRAIALAEERGVGEAAVTYRLRDWLVSRQRYWGAPIPIIHCETDGIVPVPESELPVLLPENVEFEPTGKSPLTLREDWVNVPCPKCGQPARRETDTLDTFMCSSWYQMRYTDPHNAERPFAPERAAEWLPVDQYTGGAEHAVMHLLYTRFFWKAARDMGHVQGDEPMTRLFNQGIILGPDGQKMSKSRGNVIAPDAEVDRYGTDAFRCQLMFVGPWDQGGPFNPEGISGITRWLNRVWAMATEEVETEDAPESEGARSMRRLTHQTIAAVTAQVDDFRFNTMIARLMEHANGMQKYRESGKVDAKAWTEGINTMILMMAPLTPHLSEELWERRGNEYSVHLQRWPVADPALMAEEEVEIVIQVNGKVRGRLTLPTAVTEHQAREAALSLSVVAERLNGNEPRRVIYVPGKLINVVA